MSSLFNAFDTETGGLEVKYALLTLYFAVYDKDFNFLEDLELYTGPSRNVADYMIQPKAMEINKIDLDAHVKREDFLDYKQCGKKLTKWCEDLKEKYKPGRSRLFLPVTQNGHFDIKFITHYLMSPEEWEEYFHHNVRDTLGNAVFLRDAGLWPDRVGPLGTQVDHLDLKMGDAHVAKDDVHMTVRVYKKQLELLRNAKNDISKIPSNLLKIVEG